MLWTKYAAFCAVVLQLDVLAEVLTCSLHVDSVHGNDISSGTSFRSALRSLRTARDTVRSLPRPLPATGVTVCVHPGVYEPLVLDSPLDSGDSSGRVTWHGLPQPGRPVLLTGGVPITFTPAPTTGSPSLWQAQLYAQGVQDVGTWQPHGFLMGNCGESPLELFADGNGTAGAWAWAGVGAGAGVGARGADPSLGLPYTVARWPNIAEADRLQSQWDREASWARAQFKRGIDCVLPSALYLNTSATPIGGWGPPPPAPPYQARAQGEEEDITSTSTSAVPWPWVWSGYGFYDWADANLPITGYNASSGFMNLQPGLMPYNVTYGAKFFVQNAVEALDAPGEYFIDPTTGTASLIPLTQPEGQTLTAWASVNSTGVTLTRQTNVTLSSLTIATLRGNGVSVVDGNGIILLDLTVTGVGVDGISVLTSNNSAVLGCNVSYAGGAGISVYGGGDRSTLTSSGITVADCRVTAVGRRCMSYQAGISADVIGAVVAHNEVSNTPHRGLSNSANDALVEYNVVHHTVLAACDMGALYDGAEDWSVWNTSVQYNLFYLNGWSEVGSNPQTGSDVGDIYFDEGMSGARAVGNVHWMPVPTRPFSYLSKNRTMYAHLLNGGSNVEVTNSIIIDANISTYESASGLYNNFDLWCSVNGTRIQGMQAMHWNTGLYAEHYPALAALNAGCSPTPAACASDSGCPAAPIGVSYTLSANVNVSAVLAMGRNDTLWPATRVNTSANWVGLDPGFQDTDPRASLNFQLRADSPLYALGFQRIPMECFGPGVCVQAAEGALYPRAAHHRVQVRDQE